MIKSWLLKLVPALLLILLAGTALAGGVVITLDEAVTGAIAGTAFDVDFTIRSAHDGSLQDGWHPIVAVTDPETGETLTFRAEAREEPGQYTASLTLPAAGEWTWRIIPDATYPEELIAEMTPISVQPAAPAVSVPAQAAPATVPVVAWGVAALVSLAALGLVLLGLRRRAVVVS